MKKAEIDQGNLSISDESENDEREETKGMRHNRRQEYCGQWTLSCYTSKKSGEKKEEILLGGNGGNERRKGVK